MIQISDGERPFDPAALIPPPNCGRKWLPLCTSPPTSTSARPFTVVTYNLLATAHIGDARIKAEYSHLPDNMKFVAREEYRVPRLAAELGSYGATVLCLQEVDAVDFNGKRPLPVMLGDATGTRYDWKFHARALPPNCPRDSRQEGLAIVWDTSRARLIGPPPFFIDFNTLSSNNDDKTNNGALLALLEIDGCPVAVLCVYLHWNPEKKSLKERQATHARRVAEDTCRTYEINALIIAGDFNSVPDHGIYYAHTRDTRQGWDRPLTSAYGQYLPLEQRYVPPKLRQVGGCAESVRTDYEEPRYTNVNPHKGFVDTLDYVLFTPSRLRAHAVLQLPPGPETMALPDRKSVV